MKKIAMIGHSHIVAVLDAMGQWRASANMEGGQENKNDTDAFRDWYTADTGGKLFELIPRERYGSLRGLKVSVLTGRTAYGVPLAKIKVEGRHVHFDLASIFLPFIEGTSDFDVVISVLYGSEVYQRTLVNNLPEYDFAPFENDQNSRRPIDISYINQCVAHDVSTVLAPLLAMRALLKKPRLIHVAPPPPPKDLSTCRTFANLEHLVRQYGWLRPSLRLKWYLFYLSHLRAAVSEQGITLIEPGEEAMSEDGFLRPGFSEDLTHGNSHYGKIIADKIAKYLEV